MTPLEEQLIRELRRVALQHPALVTLANEAQQVHAMLPALDQLDAAALRQVATGANDERERLLDVYGALKLACNDWLNPSLHAYDVLRAAAERRLEALELESIDPDGRC